MTPPIPHVHKDWKKMFWNVNKMLFLGGAINDYYFLIQYILFFSSLCMYYFYNQEN